MKHKLSFIILFCILTIGSIWFVHNSSAFVGPPAGTAGNTTGIFITNGTNLKIGGDPSNLSSLADTKLTIVASTTLNTSYVFKLLHGNETSATTTLFSVRNWGGVSIGTSTDSSSASADPSPPVGGDLKRLYVNGRIVANSIEIGNCTGAGCGGGSVSLLSSGVFGSSLSGSSTLLYSFPYSLGVGTSTQVGLPQRLSVYGGGYFSGNLGIGTSSPQMPLVINTPSAAHAQFLELKNQASPTGDSWVVGNSVLGQLDTYMFYNKNLGSGAPIISALRNNSGLVGVGIKGVTWPTVALEVGGDLKVYATTTLATTDGNVGINTTSPTQKLHVVGKGIISDQLLVSTTTVPTSTYKLTVGGSILLGGTAGVDGIKFADGTTQFSAASSSGSGTAGRISKWSSSSNLTNSIMYEVGSNIGINNSSPLSRLDILTSNGTSSMVRIATNGAVGYGIKMFVSTTSTINKTGWQTCAAVQANSACIAYISDTGVDPGAGASNNGCGNASNGNTMWRALCVIGDER